MSGENESERGVEHRRFVAFVPLSNWLRAFDRYRRRWSKALLTESRFPEAFYMHREDEDLSIGLSKTRALVARLGQSGDAVLALVARLPVGAGGMERNRTTGTDVGWRWPSPSIPVHEVAWVDDHGALSPTSVEEVTARAFTIGTCSLVPWAQARPRSFSVLPIARACQARCAFCFSKGSVSELAKQTPIDLELVDAWATHARDRGAERAVITGGGEPTLLDVDALVALVSLLHARLEKVTLITNGARLDRERLVVLAGAGLSVLAISRHGLDADHDASIMGIDAASARLAPIAREHRVRARSICVLQRDGVRDVDGVRAYVRRCANEGFDEVCFKELYVSSLAESPWADGAINAYAEREQVPLSIVVEALEPLGFHEVDRLPWGAPVLAGCVAGRRVRVAAYTEPSVGWERTHGVVRSWNLLSEGRCFASLEDPSSLLPLEGARSRRLLALLDPPSTTNRART